MSGMRKPAPTEHEVHPLIRDRWSPRTFSDQPVEAHTLLSLLEAARWAPSSYNEQPWSFILATKDQVEGFERLTSCLTPGNQSWAQHAAALIVSVAKLTFERNRKTNRHAYHDIGLAAAQLTLQATALGLSVHQMAGIDVEKIRTAYSIPAGYDPVTGIAVGYPSDADALSEETRAREFAPRQRKSLEAFVYAGAWGQRAPIVST